MTVLEIIVAVGGGVFLLQLARWLNGKRRRDERYDNLQRITKEMIGLDQWKA